jgi:hypothetical protein
MLLGGEMPEPRETMTQKDGSELCYWDSIEPPVLRELVEQFKIGEPEELEPLDA